MSGPPHPEMGGLQLASSGLSGFPGEKGVRPLARGAPVKAALSPGSPWLSCPPRCCVTGREPPDLGATEQSCRMAVMLRCQASGKTARRGPSVVGRKAPPRSAPMEVSMGPHWAESRFQEGWPGVLGLQLRCDLTLYPYPDLCHSSIKQPTRPRGVSGGFRSGGVGV